MKIKEEKNKGDDGEHLHGKWWKWKNNHHNKQNLITTKNLENNEKEILLNIQLVATWNKMKIRRWPLQCQNFIINCCNPNLGLATKAMTRQRGNGLGIS
jgi:hypothetical protein